MTKYWVAVASAEHARRGKVGFMQVNHGKKTPLQRIRAGDGVTYYSPAETIRGKDRLQSFTTIGRVRDEDLYQGEMGGDFTPWRRNVDYARQPQLGLPDAIWSVRDFRARFSGHRRRHAGRHLNAAPAAGLGSAV
ncbi:EVE domain-containing protein [Devosia sp.]|uniref:EVE domain-containing protein n=1 Tax=Devosia sp. TaxID=1871048 RepID=UPI0034583374